jgi:hypothetical protein
VVHDTRKARDIDPGFFIYSLRQLMEAMTNTTRSRVEQKSTCSEASLSPVLGFVTWTSSAISVPWSRAQWWHPRWESHSPSLCCRSSPSHARSRLEKLNDVTIVSDHSAAVYEDKARAWTGFLQSVKVLAWNLFAKGVG